MCQVSGESSGGMVFNATDIVSDLGEMEKVDLVGPTIQNPGPMSIRSGSRDLV